MIKPSNAWTILPTENKSALIFGFFFFTGAIRKKKLEKLKKFQYGFPFSVKGKIPQQGEGECISLPHALEGKKEIGQRLRRKTNVCDQ